MVKKAGIFPFAVFLGAFLLFQIQPLIGKYFLPWLGGSSGVWITCLMFFQLLLLGGYIYAHLLQRLSPRQQVLVHLGLLTLALLGGIVFFFVWGSPILPSTNWRPDHTSHPGWDIFRLLFVSIGASYFLLSTSSPLLQAWFHRTKPSISPYVLYVVSNIAALLALLSYPFVVEPMLTLKTQALLWSGGFFIYVILCLLSARKVWPILIIEKESPAVHLSEIPSWKNVLHWNALSACGVLALMAISNQITQDIPPVPFLWILPLVLFLLAYIIGFTSRLCGLQKYYIWLIPLAVIIAWALISSGQKPNIIKQISGYGAILFCICLFCHNALYQKKSPPRYLTSFYLSISLGGVLGGIFTATIAPWIFNQYWEYPLCIVFAVMLVIVSIYSDKRNQFYRIRHSLWLAPIVLAFLVLHKNSEKTENAVYMGRNFFGCIVIEKNFGSRDISAHKTEEFPIFTMYHGRTKHGLQMDQPELKTWPTTYFCQNSGVGRAILNHPKRISGKPMRVGILGLGVGTLAAYGRPGDLYCFYEIDPEVILLAQHSPWFSYLKDSPAEIQVVEGDGRISLEDELKNGSREYDVLVLDVFSGDQIPIHILTKEAFDIYLRHLAEGGVIAVHISSRYLDLLPQLIQLKNHFGLDAAYIEDSMETQVSYASDWVLLSRNEQFMKQPAIARANTLHRRPIRKVRLWTDNYANLVSVLK